MYVVHQAMVDLVRGEQCLGTEGKEVRLYSNSGGGPQHYHQEGGYHLHFSLFTKILTKVRRHLPYYSLFSQDVPYANIYMQ